MFKKLRKDFPILSRVIDGKPIIYLDNAATSQKPKQVIGMLLEYYENYNSNIFRAIHKFSEISSTLFEGSREKIQKFINAKSEKEVIFTKGTTESINFVASTWGEEFILGGDEIIVSEMEHHANLIPWQQLAHKKDAILKFIPITKDGKLDLDAYAKLLTPNTKLVSIIHASNVLGTVNDVKRITEMAHSIGAKVMVDAAQSVPHKKIDVQDIGCDFMAFSGHKMLAPTGIGVLFVKESIQQQVPPYQFGGGMVFEVSYENATWNCSPAKYEAGTPPIAQAIGLGEAIDYFNDNIDFDELEKYEASLCKRAIDGLLDISGVKIYGPLDELIKEGHLVSFTFDGLHAHDVAAYLDSRGICVRAGHHCAQPLSIKLGINATIRASFYFYNTEEEVDKFLDAMRDLRKEFKI
jgi:cysteine desulfurase/selenocysteine lyase